MVEIPPEDGLEQDKMTPVSISLCVLNGTGLKGAGVTEWNRCRAEKEILLELTIKDAL